MDAFLSAVQWGADNLGKQAGQPTLKRQACFIPTNAPLQRGNKICNCPREHFKSSPSAIHGNCFGAGLASI